MIAMPNADSHNARVLQEDNTDLVRIACMPMPTPPLAHALNRATCSAGVRVRAQVPRVSDGGQLQLHATLPDLCTLLKSGTPRRTWTRRASMRCASLHSTPSAQPLTGALPLAGRGPPLLPRRRRCAPALPTRSARLQAHLRAPLALRRPPARLRGAFRCARLKLAHSTCACLILTPLPCLLPERISENAEKLQCARDPSNPSLLALVGGGPRKLTLPLRACAGWARFRNACCS
jgi:hypothetical protein